MSQEQLAALIARLQEDVSLREKLKGAADLDAVVAMAQEAGFDVRKEDWSKYQDGEVEFSDKELESVAGGIEICAGYLDIRLQLMGTMGRVIGGLIGSGGITP